MVSIFLAGLTLTRQLVRNPLHDELSAPQAGIIRPRFPYNLQ